jgi:hypothetical protein
MEFSFLYLGSSETLSPIYQATRRHIPEDTPDTAVRTWNVTIADRVQDLYFHWKDGLSCRYEQMVLFVPSVCNCIVCYLMSVIRKCACLPSDARSTWLLERLPHEHGEMYVGVTILGFHSGSNVAYDLNYSTVYSGKWWPTFRKNQTSKFSRSYKFVKKRKLCKFMFKILSQVLHKGFVLVIYSPWILWEEIFLDLH